METGKYFSSNQKKISRLTESDWKVALAKCKKHIALRLGKRTLYGAHSASNLGTEAVEHYLGLCYEKILLGDWEWKDGRTIFEQMVRIADRQLSAEVEKVGTDKAAAFKTVYKEDIDVVFNELLDEDCSREDMELYQARCDAIETAVAGDEDLEFFWEGIKEGKKREEIAALLGLSPKQLDKIRERFIRKVKKI